MTRRSIAGRVADLSGRSTERIRELARYAIVGVFNAATYLALYVGLVLAGVPYVLAAALAFPLPVALGYWLHEHWTFGGKQPTARGLGGFLAIQLAALGLDIVMLVILVDGLGMGPIAARLVTTPLGAALSYLTSRVLIFGGRGRRPSAPEA